MMNLSVLRSQHFRLGSHSGEGISKLSSQGDQQTSQPGLCVFL